MVLAQSLLADGQGIIEQVGSLLVLVLVPRGRCELMNGILQPKALLPRSLGSLLLPVLTSEHDGGMTQGIEKHGQPLPSGLGGSGQEAHAVLGYEPDPPHALPSLPRAQCSLWSIPPGLCSCCSFCQRNFSNPLTFWANSTFTIGPPQALVSERLCPVRLYVAPSPVMSKPVSRTRLRHDV